MTSKRPASILVLGSLNLDLVLRPPRMPAAGETIACGEGAQFRGGKGANQAVACARLGADVVMIGRIGDDPAGHLLRGGLLDEGIDDRAVMSTPDCASGQAVILLTPDGQNRILLAAGANARLSPADVAAHAVAFEKAGLLICQLEVPQDTVAAAIGRAGASGLPVLLNPAPARPLPPGMLARIDYLVPNETEAALLTGRPLSGVEDAFDAAQALRRQGARNVIVTLGGSGVAIADESGCRHFPALPVQVVDTTAAGDSFIGGLATGLIEGLSLDDAAHLGLRAASLSVGRLGAQAALPRRAEL